LIERRLMLVYSHDLSRQTIGELADLLVDAGRLPGEQREAAIDRAMERLERIYARRIRE
jgi:hypothetical protein